MLVANGMPLQRQIAKRARLSRGISQPRPQNQALGAIHPPSSASPLTQGGAYLMDWSTAHPRSAPLPTCFNPYAFSKDVCSAERR
ncbi:hypothetical protein PGT21_025340 [Puccinia graminis f. sp. tritici]|uniref:Uncharacterized protein n=1 Tax=Puccinia graminis f. sp. tritici TaxID=56615 RepID=A0A5B0MXW6_PUCGR|nr:hypothetical protein PGT21_025340 [Puccinia graminis f. sp. tritici]